MSNTITPTVFYRTLNVEGLEIFYREAGPRDALTVLLLHGFPSSSHMFRNLIPMLADKYSCRCPRLPWIWRKLSTIGQRFRLFLVNVFPTLRLPFRERQAELRLNIRRSSYVSG